MASFCSFTLWAVVKCCTGCLFGLRSDRRAIDKLGRRITTASDGDEPGFHGMILMIGTTDTK